MQKIDKSIILSTAYKKWEEKFESSQKDHPVFDNNASKKKFYKDIVMNLFYCQGGLCAYTEQHLCLSNKYDKQNWDSEGKYISFGKKGYKAELEHFDPSKKAKKGWLWDNLFMIESNTNNLKGAKEVDYILKPDADDYSPDKYLVYSSATGLFLPNPQCSQDIQIRVQKMLDVLEINEDWLVDKRKFEVERFLLFPSANPREFPTAIRMSQI